MGHHTVPPLQETNDFFKIGEQMQISRKNFFLKIICFPALVDEIIAGNRWNFPAWGKNFKNTQNTEGNTSKSLGKTIFGAKSWSLGGEQMVLIQETS